MSACTAIVLTKDEEANLVRCLDSLRWCREIVVIDSGSTDGTQERAGALGAQVLVHIQAGPFNIAEQRNWALAHARLADGWVLFLDADETMPPELAAEITRITTDATLAYTAYELTPRYLFWGRWLRRTQGYPNWHARLLKVGATRFTGGVWEHFATAQVGRISIPYDHHANSKGLSDWLARHDRYSSWDAEKIVDFLESGNPGALGTNRKLGLRCWAARLWPLRPVARFVQMYFLRLGFTEGMPAFVFCLLYATYEFMTVVKIVELKRRRRGFLL